MIRKAKVCLIGATAVGKSSLVARYVRSVFSEHYLTTIGVRIETHVVDRITGPIELVVWDLSGEDEFQSVQTSYLRGARGFLLVIDGTRRETMDAATALEASARRALGPVPFVVVLNKVDLDALWDLTPADVAEMRRRGWKIVETSAKTGAGVKDAFGQLADAIFAEVQPWT